MSREKIEYVEPDAVASTLITNDPLYSSQWALPKISWDKLDASADAFNPADPAVEVAVVDTGVDYTHPDLTGKVDIAKDKDFVNNDDDAMDDNLHGTHVAGLAGLLFSQHSDWSASAVRNKIESTADPVGGRLYKRGNLGKGRINVFKAVTQ